MRGGRPGRVSGAADRARGAVPFRKPAKPDTFDEALATVGLDRCTLGFTAKDFSTFGATTTHDAFRLPRYDAVHDHAVRAPAFATMLVGALDDASGSTLPVTGALQVAAYGLGAKAVPCLTPFEIDEAQPLARAIAQIIRDAGGELTTVGSSAGAIRMTAVRLPLDSGSSTAPHELRGTADGETP